MRWKHKSAVMIKLKKKPGETGSDEERKAAAETKQILKVRDKKH